MAAPNLDPVTSQSSTAADVRAAVLGHADPHRAEQTARFFRTGPGEYGEGDVFVGVAVPVLRTIAAAHADLPLTDLRDLLDDAEHEHRFTALAVMTEAYKRALRPRTRDDARCHALHASYLDALDGGGVDNWDLVDLSAPWLIGEHVRVHGRVDGDRVLDDLWGAEDLWRRRAGIVATLAHLRAGDAGPTHRAVLAVLDDRRPLVQKAAGWMLRESGSKVSSAGLLDFLHEHAGAMGRTALTVATEKLDPTTRARLRALRPEPPVS